MAALVIPPGEHFDRHWELEAFFRLRRRVYVDQLGWTRSDDAQRERDVFDACAPTYVLYVDAGGAVRAGVRLHCSVHDTMIARDFPDGVEAWLERRPGLWESSRMTYSPSLGADPGALAEITAAALRWLLDARADHLMTFLTPHQARMFRRLGLRPTRQGPVLKRLSAWGFAAWYAVDPETVAAAAAAADELASPGAVAA